MDIITYINFLINIHIKYDYVERKKTMKKILSLLTGIGITVASMPSVIAANAYDKNKTIVVTNHEVCTKMAKKYIKAYPKITSPELFIITSTCEGIVNPMDSGLGGGFQMVLHTAKNPSEHYINSREKSGAVVPYQSGNTPQHIGVPSMLAGY